MPSTVFLLVTAGLLPLYFIVPRLLSRCRPERVQATILLLVSVGFYAWAGWQNLIALLLLWLSCVLVTAVLQRMQVREEQQLARMRARAPEDQAARRRYKDRQRRRQRVIVTVGVCFAVGQLAVLQHGVGRSLLAGYGVTWIAPLGLSYLTLQAIGYMVDVLRRQQPYEKNWLLVLLYLCYFPTLYQGPIERYGERMAQLLRVHTFDARRVLSGLIRMLWGFVKKSVIADTVGVAVIAIAQQPTAFDGTGVLLLIVLYSIQIYGDFTGGMDVVLGVSDMLGITLFENFDHPFAATSLKEYWRRWHRSMGRWFEAYVYYPLATARPLQRLGQWLSRVLGEGVGRRLPLYGAVLLTWCATGLWHGLDWNFLVWGLCNGVCILLSQEISRHRVSHRRNGPPRPWLLRLCAAGTFCLVGLFRTLDVYRDVGQTFSLWGRMLHPASVAGAFDAMLWSRLGLRPAQWVLIALGVLAMWLVSRHTPRVGATDALPLRLQIASRPIASAALCATMVVVILIFGNYGLGYEPMDFIYGRF